MTCSPKYALPYMLALEMIESGSDEPLGIIKGHLKIGRYLCGGKWIRMGLEAIDRMIDCWERGEPYDQDDIALVRRAVLRYDEIARCSDGARLQKAILKALYDV